MCKGVFFFWGGVGEVERGRRGLDIVVCSG